MGPRGSGCGSLVFGGGVAGEPHGTLTELTVDDKPGHRFFTQQVASRSPLQYSCLENPMDGRAW